MPTVRIPFFSHAALAACAFTAFIAFFAFFALVPPAASAPSALAPQTALSTRTALNPQPLPPQELVRAGTSATTRIAPPVANQKTGIIIVGGAPVARPKASVTSAKPQVHAASAP